MDSDTIVGPAISDRRTWLKLAATALAGLSPLPRSGRNRAGYSNARDADPIPDWLHDPAVFPVSAPARPDRSEIGRLSIRRLGDDASGNEHGASIRWSPPRLLPTARRSSLGNAATWASSRC